MAYNKCPSLLKYSSPAAPNHPRHCPLRVGTHIATFQGVSPFSPYFSQNGRGVGIVFGFPIVPEGLE